MSGFTFSRAVFVLAATAILLAGCGGDSDLQGMIQEQIERVSQLEEEYDLDSTGQAAIEQLGEPSTAAYAVLKASDNGYSPYQVAIAISAGLLDESGVIQGVTPAWPAGNGLSSPESAPRFIFAYVGAGTSTGGVFADNGGVPVGLGELQQMFGEVGDQDRAGRWLAWILGVTGCGYTVEQITQFLDENPPSKEGSPPTIGGVPFVRAQGGGIVDPERPADWPYRGRNVLSELQNSDDFDFYDNLAVFVIGLVNAGYTSAQIEEAVRWDRIGLCTTADGETITVGWINQDNELVPPAGDLAGSYVPAVVVVADVLTLMPGTGGSAGAAGSDNASRLEDGETVTITLIPDIVSQDSTVVITSHEVVMEVQRSEGGSFCYITCRWRIEFTQVEDEYAYDHVRYPKGFVHVCEGEAGTEPSKPVPLDNFKDLSVSYEWTVQDAAQGYVDNFGNTNVRGFGGSLDEDLYGGGWFPGGAFPAKVNWYSFPPD